MVKETKKFLPLIEERRYEHKGVFVDVRINYRKQRITLIEKNRTKKHWIFAEREDEYLDGWLNILDAMKYAIKEARKSLVEYNNKKLETDYQDFLEKRNIFEPSKLDKSLRDDWDASFKN